MIRVILKRGVKGCSLSGGDIMKPVSRAFRLETIAQAVSWLVVALTLAVAAYFVARSIYYEVAICLASLAIFIYCQFFLNRRHWLRNPPGMQLFVAAVFFIGLTAGRFFFLYRDLPGFDKFAHLLYGMAFGIIGYPLFYRINPAQQEKPDIRPATVLLFSVGLAMTCSFLWEVYEFVFDRLFGTNMQHWLPGPATGVNDTMLDMLADLLGALVVGFSWLREQRRDPRRFWRRRIAPFLVFPANGAGPVAGHD
jgi:uncharacterized membrane protein YjdF